VLDGKAKTYYLEDGMTSDDLVLKCIDAMLVNDYKGYTFYTHNLGRYDSTFLVKILKEFNIKVGYEHYILKAVCRDNKPLKLTIKVKRSLSDRKQSKTGVRRDPGFNSITIVDSLNLLNQSLDKLCDSFSMYLIIVKGKWIAFFEYHNDRSNLYEDGVLSTKGAVSFNHTKYYTLDPKLLSERPHYTGSGGIRVSFEDGDKRPEVVEGVFLPLETEDVTVEKVLRWIKDHKPHYVGKASTAPVGVPPSVPSDSAPFSASMDID
jgi:DNA polymerase type B, organellar and viral